LVDPDSLLHDLNSSKTITLREALNLGLIDSQVNYPGKFKINFLLILGSLRT